MRQKARFNSPLNSRLISLLSKNHVWLDTRHLPRTFPTQDLLHTLHSFKSFHLFYLPQRDQEFFSRSHARFKAKSTPLLVFPLIRIFSALSSRPHDTHSLCSISITKMTNSEAAKIPSKERFYPSLSRHPLYSSETSIPITTGGTLFLHRHPLKQNNWSNGSRTKI